jgi:sugar lactone lactonase YvrE
VPGRLQTGNRLRTIGDAGRIDAAAGVAVDEDGGIYVADFYHHRIQVFAADGAYLRQWGANGSGPGELNYPTDVAVAAGGSLVVADAYNHRVQVFARDGTFQRELTGPSGDPFNVATAVAVGPDGEVYVADFYHHRIRRFTVQGQLVAEFGRPGKGPGELDRPADMAVDDAGVLFVVDFGNDRIQVFRPIRSSGDSVPGRTSESASGLGRRERQAAPELP